jgi:hypothetical protein
LRLILAAPGNNITQQHLEFYQRCAIWQQEFSAHYSGFLDDAVMNFCTTERLHHQRA